MSTKLTQQQRRAYVKQAKTQCPICESKEFYAYQLVSNGGEAWQKFQCNLCSLTWLEIYKLADVETEADYESA